MKKLIYLLLLVVSASCIKDNEVENTIWLDVSLPHLLSPRTQLFDFHGDSVSIVEIGDGETGQIDTALVFTFYNIKDDNYLKLVNEKDTLLINIVSSDSSNMNLEVLNTKEQRTTKIQLQKLSSNEEQSVSKEDLAGKIFTVDNIEFVKWLHFYDDYSLFDERYQGQYDWTIVNYKGIEFLNTTNSVLPRLPIKKRGDTIYYKSGSDPFQEFTSVVPIQPMDSLLGQWIEISRYPPSPSLIKTDTLQTLVIGKDSLTVKRYDHSQPYHYKISPNNKLFFPNSHLNASDGSFLIGAWEIKELTSDYLRILESSELDYAIVDYQRVNPEVN